jgi:hypothetical protein
MHSEGVRGAVQRELPVLFSEGAVHLSASPAILHARITLLAALQRELLKRLKVCTAHPRSSIQTAAQHQAASSQCQWNVQREFRAVFALALIPTSCFQVVATNVAAVEVTLSCNIPFYTAHTACCRFFFATRLLLNTAPGDFGGSPNPRCCCACRVRLCRSIAGKGAWWRAVSFQFLLVSFSLLYIAAPCFIHPAADASIQIQWLQQRMEAMIASGSALHKGELQQLQV